MTYALLETALETAAALAGYTDVGWDELETRWRSASHIRFTILSDVPVGQQERRQIDIGADTYTERVYQPKQTTIQITCESQDQSPGDSAWEIATRVRAVLRSTQGRALLHAAGYGVASVGGSVPVKYTRDGRLYSTVNFDLVLNGADVFDMAEGGEEFVLASVISDNLTDDIESGTITVYWLTEAGDNVTTEAGDRLVI